MTDRVHPTIDQEAEARKTAAGAIQHAGGSSEGWIVPSGQDPGNLATDDADIDETALDAFSETSSGSSLDVTIAPGQGYVGGSWLARDLDTTVTLAASTNGQDVFVGWDVDSSNTVIVGLSGDFDADDPKANIWTFDTDGSGVTSSTDQRNQDDFRVRNEDVQALQNFTNDEVFSGHPLGQSDLGTDSVGSNELQTNAAGASEVDQANINAEDFVSAGSDGDVLIVQADGSLQATQGSDSGLNADTVRGLGEILAEVDDSSPTGQTSYSWSTAFSAAPVVTATALDTNSAAGSQDNIVSLESTSTTGVTYWVIESDGSEAGVEEVHLHAMEEHTAWT